MLIERFFTKNNNLLLNRPVIFKCDHFNSLICNKAIYITPTVPWIV